MKNLLALISVVILCNCRGKGEDYPLVKAKIVFKDNAIDTISIRSNYGINSLGQLFHYENQYVNPKVVATEVKYVKIIDK